MAASVRQPLRLRVRCGDGRSFILSDISPSMLFCALRERIVAQAGDSFSTDSRIALAGPPPTPLEAQPNTAVGSILQSGDALMIVGGSASTPAKIGSNVGGVSKSRGSGGAASMSAPTRGRGISRRRAGAAAAAGRAKARAFRSAGKGRSLASAAATTGPSVSGSGTDGGEVEKANNVGSAQGALEGALMGSMTGKRGDAFSRSFRQSLQEERQNRYSPAEGQRRYSAFLSKKFSISYFRYPDEDALVFRVTYCALNERRWRNDPPGEDDTEASYFPTWRKAVVGGVIAQLLTPEENGEDHEVVRDRLRPIQIARYSPGLFWNLVRLYGENIEQGMRELVPDADWSFLKTRIRRLSEKAKRNAEQAAQAAK